MTTTKGFKIKSENGHVSTISASTKRKEVKRNC